MAQTKFIRVTKGAILDVAVDIRQGSPTYGLYVSKILTADSQRQLLVPRDFTHGFITLIDNTEVMYKVDQYYSSEHDRSMLWSDSQIGITWPFENPIFSEKDGGLKLLNS